MATGTKRSVTNKTLKEKYKALKELEKGHLIKILRKSTKFPRIHFQQNLDKVVFQCFLSVRSQDVPIWGAVFKAKANFYTREAGLYDFQASDSWTRRRKEGYSVTFKKRSREASSVTTEMVAQWNEISLPTLLSQYKLEDIYNADEFGLFYQCMPENSMHLKSESFIGGKHSKVRLTGMPVASAAREKLSIFVNGKSKGQDASMGLSLCHAIIDIRKKLDEQWVVSRMGRRIGQLISGTETKGFSCCRQLSSTSRSRKSESSQACVPAVKHNI